MKQRPSYEANNCSTSQEILLKVCYHGHKIPPMVSIIINWYFSWQNMFLLIFIIVLFWQENYAILKCLLHLN